MKRRKDSFFGLHFDFHASPESCPDPIGATLKEEEIREICQTLHPDFLQIDCKGHPGWASYPTKCGNAMPQFNGDPLKVWRRVTKEEGVALYMHYSGVMDEKYCAAHPDQQVMQADGTYITEVTLPRGTYVDDLLIPQLMELAGEYGVDGVWLDGECWACHVDFRDETVRMFEEETGITLNGQLPAKPEDPYFEEYRAFHRELFRRYLRHYVNTLHEKYPELQIASNWAFSDHMPEAVCADVDFISGDLNPGDSFFSARYAGRAIAQQAYTWDLMSWNFRINVGGGSLHVAKHPVQVMQEAAAVISLGGGFQNYIIQHRDGSPKMEEIRRMKPLAEFMRAREPYCFRGKPVHQTAILLSTYDRNRESRSLYSRNGNSKIVGLTGLLCDAGHSVELVSEHTISGKCTDYPVLVVPELYCGLADQTMVELLDYAKKGGSLLLIGAHTCKLFAAAGAPFRVGDEVPEGGLFTQNASEYGGAYHIRPLFTETGKVVAVFGANIRAEKSPYAVMVPYGKGKIAAVGSDLGEAYYTFGQYLHRDLVNELLDELYTPIVRVACEDGLVETVVLEKDGKRMIQLINANGNHRSTNIIAEDRIPACREVQVSILANNVPQAIRLQPENVALDFEYRDGRVELTVDKLAIHEILEIVE